MIEEIEIKNDVVKPVRYNSKKIGIYECIDTKNECIKKVMDKHGGYVVLLDYGNELVKKNGKLVYKRKQSVRHVKSEDDAIRLRDEARTIREALKNAPLHNITIPECMVIFRKTVEYNNLGESSKRCYNIYYKHVAEYFKDKPMKDIMPVDIESYLLYLSKQGRYEYNNVRKDKPGLSCNSIRKHRFFLIALYRCAMKNDKTGITRNVAQLSTLPIENTIYKISDFHSHPLSLEELNYELNFAIEHYEDPSALLILGFGALAGLRHSEIKALTFKKIKHDDMMGVESEVFDYIGSDIEFYKKHSELALIDLAACGHNHDILKLPKEEHIHIIGMCKVLEEIIEYYIKWRLTFEKISSSDYVFKSLSTIISSVKEDSSYYVMDRVWRNFQVEMNKFRKHQGLEAIPNIRMHDLRHTFATICNVYGVPSLEISKQMGHSIDKFSNTTTEAVYISDRQPKRDNIIKIMNDNIEVDWSKAIYKF